MLIIRALTTEDLPLLCDLDTAAFDESWSSESLAAELAHEHATVAGAFLEKTLVGAILLRVIGDERWIMRIMTHPEYRQKGIAQKLLRHIYDRNDLWLEVRAGNTSALALYYSEGFIDISVRRGYYGSLEDAVIMCRHVQDDILDYQLLDCGNGFKLERFGNNTVIRPDREARGQSKIPSEQWQADAIAVEDKKGHVLWQKNTFFCEPWQISYGQIVGELHAESSRNIGIFPEQAANWQWLQQVLSESSELRVLNLFAYTGFASLVCAQAGAQITHVDAAKSTVRWASRNQELSDLKASSIRWIVDDAVRFIEREIKRGVKYDAVILDPPPVGRAAGKSFHFSQHVERLLGLCRQVLVADPAFVLLNCYGLNYLPQDAKALLEKAFPSKNIESGELTLSEKKRDATISCSVYARFS